MEYGRTETFTRVAGYFPSKDGLKCHYWFWKPKTGANTESKTDESSVDKPFPIIVMGHGFGCQKDFGLSSFARHFLEQGIAVLAFDYRHFGGSEGEPRNLIEPTRLIDDWFAALDFVVDGKLAEFNVNPDKIGIWGSSLAGGHVVVVAATYPRKKSIKAVISQVPLADGLGAALASAMVLPISWSLRLGWDALVDSARVYLKMPRYYIPLVGKPNEAPGMMATWDSYTGYGPLVPEGLPRVDPVSIYAPDAKNLGGWQNKAPAAFGLLFAQYRPTTFAAQVEAPTLVLAADDDTLCPVSDVKKMAGKLQNGKLVVLEKCGHFEPYAHPKFFPIAIGHETAFLQEHLLK